MLKVLFSSFRPLLSPCESYLLSKLGLIIQNKPRPLFGRRKQPNVFFYIYFFKQKATVQQRNIGLASHLSYTYTTYTLLTAASTF